MTEPSDEALVERVERLERSARRARRVAWSAVAAAGLALLGGRLAAPRPAAADGQKVVAEEFVLRGYGRARATWAVRPDGSVALAFRDGKGRVRAEWGVTEDGAPFERKGRREKFSLGKAAPDLDGAGKQKLARADAEALDAAILAYHADTGNWPRGFEDLFAERIEGWDGPYLAGDAKSLVDPWGRPYQYLEQSGEPPYVVGSFGSDGRIGGEGEKADVLLHERR